MPTVIAKPTSLEPAHPRPADRWVCHIEFNAASAVGATFWQIDSIVELYVPTVLASTTLNNDINASLAKLRGRMLTGNLKSKAERAAIWADKATEQIVSHISEIQSAIGDQVVGSGKLANRPHLQRKGAEELLDEVKAA